METLSTNDLGNDKYDLIVTGTDGNTRSLGTIDLTHDKDPLIIPNAFYPDEKQDLIDIVGYNHDQYKQKQYSKARQAYYVTKGEEYQEYKANFTPTAERSAPADFQIWCDPFTTYSEWEANTDNYISKTEFAIEQLFVKVKAETKKLRNRYNQSINNNKTIRSLDE